MQRGIDYKKLKILLIEDELHTRTVIKSLLHQMGIDVIIEATNGRDGLVEVLREQPHVVLCDIHMKPVNGLEFLQTLRDMEDAQIKKTPVIFLTGDAQRDTVLFAKEHSINGYIVKPPSLATVKSHIDPIAATLKL
jgi:two-component system chemotaxis response regulator CheY